MKSANLSFSICIPVYKGSHLLNEALESVLNQDHVNFEVIIGDDNHPADIDEIKKTKTIITQLQDPRIRYFKNENNLGYPANIKKIVSHANHDIVFLMAQDDILAQDALKVTHDAFFLDQDVGAVTRPYFWFEKDIHAPVRAIFPPTTEQHTILTLQDNPSYVLPFVIESVGQLSGLAMRRSLMKAPIHETHVFTCHVYPFLDICNHHKVVYLKDYTVAVRIEDSQSRHVSSIYNISPTYQWISLIEFTFSEKSMKQANTVAREIMTTNYIGLIQLKNYAKPAVLPKEIIELIRQRRENIINPSFWLYALLTLLTPKRILIPLTDWYKRHILSRSIQYIPFKRQSGV